MYFNPRTPCGVRRHTAGQQPRQAYFNPRTPCGVRRWPFATRSGRSGFQSTHPLRGATQLVLQAGTLSLFQSTHPLRGATLEQKIQGRFGDDFNPRTPCGVRRSRGAPLRTRFDDFNPRTPCGVRQKRFARMGQRYYISIHAPLAGCDAGVRGDARYPMRFQSTHPLRGATLLDVSILVLLIEISIHAPLAGCDSTTRGVSCADRPFQSTHPLRGATFGYRRQSQSPSYFNPRTPCGVRRGLPGDGGVVDLDFNPRTPCGVRPRQMMLALDPLNFNPRTPCGVRRKLIRRMHNACRFQSTHPLRGATGAAIITI